MYGLFIAIIIFNFIAIKTNKKLTGNQTVHIWAFTIAFQVLFDILIDFKYHGYWYFGKGIEWTGFLPHLFVVPPVNVIFLNLFPSNHKITKQISFIVFFVIAILLYELIALLPEPWGYFHNNWWRIWHSAIMDPILLLILLGYYKLICNLEIKAYHKRYKILNE
jgi:hypothetical protein